LHVAVRPSTRARILEYGCSDKVDAVGVGGDAINIGSGITDFRK
jgi:hypothetical protein